MYYNHDEKKVLGVHRPKDDKKKGSLMLEVVENEGLRFMLELPDTEVGREVKQYIERGDLGGMSFGFQVHEDKNSDEWNYQFNCGGQSFEHPQLVMKYIASDFLKLVRSSILHILMVEHWNCRRSVQVMCALNLMKSTKSWIQR